MLHQALLDFLDSLRPKAALVWPACEQGHGRDQKPDLFDGKTGSPPVFQAGLPERFKTQPRPSHSAASQTRSQTSED